MFTRLPAAVVFSLLLCSAVAPALRLSGEARGWLETGWRPGWTGRAGLQYRPDLSFDIVPNLLDAEAAATARAGLEAWGADSLAGEAAIRPYRAWLRLGGARYEARAGLQKLAFGPGVLLRPLQWFDAVDPADPTGTTDGVWGLLGRYWPAGNADIRGWILLGNSAPRAWDREGSERWIPEPGGRVQLPVPRGETGLSFHHRTVVADTGGSRQAGENRLGLDGKWDLGVGIWTELVVTHRRSAALTAPWQYAGVVGLEHTFGVGDGLAASVEHLALALAAGVPWDDPVGAGHVSGLMVGYPLGLLDRLSAIVLFDWQAGKPYAFLAWQRTLDRWLVQAAAFRGPDAPAAGLPAASGGTGLRLTAVFNH